MQRLETDNLTSDIESSSTKARPRHVLIKRPGLKLQRVNHFISHHHSRSHRLINRHSMPLLLPHLLPALQRSLLCNPLCVHNRRLRRNLINLQNTPQRGFQRPLNPAMCKARLLPRKEHPVVPITLHHNFRVQISPLLPRPEIAEGASAGEFVRGEDLACGGFEEREGVGAGEDGVQVLGGLGDATVGVERAQDGGVLFECVGSHDDASCGALSLRVAVFLWEHGVPDGQVGDHSAVGTLAGFREDVFPPALSIL
jgi:hypothetical protein